MHPLDVPAHFVHHLANVLRPHDHGSRALERLAAPPRERCVSAHRVLELGSVRLHDVARAGRGSDRPAEEHVVDEDEIGGQVLAQRGGIRLDPRVELGACALLNALHLVPLVLVEHEDGEQAAHVGTDRGRSAEVVALGVRVLGEDRHLVPLAAPLAGQLARVDVRAGPREQVPVPDEDPHGYAKPVRSIISGMVTNSNPACSFHCSRISAVA